MNVGQKNVIVTSHPDDECLWCGGLPLRFADRQWTVICCSIPRIDAERQYKFIDACKILGVSEASVLPFIETEPNAPLVGLDQLDLEGFDTIVTHNEHGEYGHCHHRSVNAHIFANWRHKNIVTIGYHAHGQGAETLELSGREVQTKLRALRSYDHVSPTDRKPKWQALIETYYVGKGINPAIETYDVH
jgi:LmbE family N-acetylglucosaminyl deacetylase